MEYTFSVGVLMDAVEAMSPLVDLLLKRREHMWAYKVTMLWRYLETFTEPAQEMRGKLVAKYGETEGTVTRVSMGSDKYPEYKEAIDAIRAEQVTVELDGLLDLREVPLGGLPPGAFKALVPILEAWE